MGSLLSKLKGSDDGQIDDVDRAILQLKTTLRKLNIEQDRLEQLITRNQNLARDLVVERKSKRALLVLKQKKMQEGQLDTVQGAVLNVTGVLANIDTKRQQNLVFNAMSQGNDAMKALRQDVSLEDFEKLKEDTAEAQEFQKNLMDFLGMESFEGEDMAELQSELEGLEELVAQENKDSLPSVPTTAPVPQQSETAQAQQQSQPTEVEEVQEALEEPLPA